MTPQTVNAVNLPLQNALNFPAAILQTPYFDPTFDAAANYGAIGAVDRARDQPQLRQSRRRISIRPGACTIGGRRPTSRGSKASGKALIDAIRRV